MLLWIISDLHLNANPGLTLPKVPRGADAIIVAGDLDRSIAAGIARLEQAATSDPVLAEVPIVYVPGNHEFEGADIAWTTAAGRVAAAKSPLDVRVLSRSTTIIGQAGRSVQVIGATLWADFALAGDRSTAMRTAARRIWDYRSIRSSCGRPIDPSDIVDQHLRDREYIAAALASPAGTPQIVVTHHLPSARSIAPRFSGWPTNPSYASHLDDLIAAGAPALWVHGHTHASLDYRIQGTRVVCNAHGYLKDGKRENLDFNGEFMIALDQHPHQGASVGKTEPV